ncbi:site-specific integrase [Bradyrhizobium sp.]|uniref:tyrosine-type recombinase/integrase n=1 Tax=Bradyrhizobium sp. TaxID=376 RepID=UPI0025BFEDB6|nr:site-specific integrase [Bradyrhizobium sp.]
MTKALTAKRIESAPSGPIRTEIPDGLLVGLYLVVQPSGAKSFAVRYRHAGQPRKLTLGAFPALSLEVARDLGGKALRAAAEGRDPATEKQAAKSDAKKAEAEAIRGQRDLYENVAREFIERHAMKSNRPSTSRETARILGLRPPPDDPSLLADIGGDVMSAWRGRRIQDITKRDVIALLDSVNDRGSPIMANRVLSAVRKLFNWCLSRDVLQVSPCTLVSPPAPERSRDRVLSDDELRLVWKAAEAEGWPFGPLVKLLVLTGQRVSEVGGMRWDEINKTQKLWTLPAERVKNGIRHEVPLPEAAIAIISTLPHIKTTEGHVFTTRRDAAVSGFSRAKNSLDATIAAGLPTGATALDHWTFHDLRRTMASGMARLGIQLQVIEKILNHSSGSFRGIVGVYQRHSYSDEKRKALEVWAAFVQSVVADTWRREDQQVVSIQDRRTGAHQ